MMLQSFFRALRDCVTGFMMLTTSTGGIDSVAWEQDTRARLKARAEQSPSLKEIDR